MSIVSKGCIMVWALFIASCLLVAFLDAFTGYDKRRAANSEEEPPIYYLLVSVLMFLSIVAVPVFAFGILFM